MTTGATCSGRVVWAGAGRSAATAERAAAAGLDDVGTIADVATAADVVVSVCPPGAAVDQARAIAAIFVSNQFAAFTRYQFAADEFAAVGFLLGNGKGCRHFEARWGLPISARQAQQGRLGVEQETDHCGNGIAGKPKVQAGLG